MRPVVAAPRDFGGDGQPLSKANLVDSFGRFHNYLRISLTERCNLRCEYCMPAEGVSDLTPKAELLTAREIERVTSVFARMGTSKVRLTGGEPTVRRDIVEICRAVAAQPGIESLGITTNGVALLQRHRRADDVAGGPRQTMLEALVEAGVSSINVSLDSLDADCFATMTRRGAATHARVLEAIAACAATPGVKTKVNCVVMRGRNHTELAAFAEKWAHAGVDVRFIEWMPFAQNDWANDILVPYAEMLGHFEEQGGALSPLEAEDPHDTTKWWQSRHGTRVGFITSMTEHFCGGCNRVRVTADGALKTCLFGKDALSLRDLLRDCAVDDAAVASAVHTALGRKHFAHGGHAGGAIGLAENADENRPMVLIGG